MGILAKYKKDQVIVPCYPSAINANISFVYLDDDIWTDYKTTYSFLKQLHHVSNGEIPCKPEIGRAHV